MSNRKSCDICGRTILPHAHYHLKMHLYADPTMPPIDTDELQEKDMDQEKQDIMNELESLSEEDLQDSVSRQFEFFLCRSCQIQFLANPLGMPRKTTPGQN